MWEEVGDRTELQYIDPHSYGRQHCVFLILQGCSTGRPLCLVICNISSATSLDPNSSGPQWPLRPNVAFPITSYLLTPSPTVWLFVLTELYNSSTPTQSSTRSLEWHFWSSSSGNNCHAVQRSLSFGASVYESIMGFFTLSRFISQARPRDLFRLLAIGMCHFLPVHHFIMVYLLGPKVKIQHLHQVGFDRRWHIIDGWEPHPNRDLCTVVTKNDSSFHHSPYFGYLERHAMNSALQSSYYP